MNAQDIAPELTEDGWRKLMGLLNEPPRANPKLAAAFKKRRPFSVRCLIATTLALGISVGVLAMIYLQRAVAEVDDAAR